MIGHNGHWVRTRTDTDAKLFMKEQQDLVDAARSSRMTRTQARTFWAGIALAALILTAVEMLLN